jgi:uncharacterized repeat protein (TIGR02543 family)
MPSSDVTLFAKWTADSHTVTFDSQGGNAISSQIFYTDGSLSLPASPIRSGYTFKGWFVSTSGGSALVSPYSPGTTSDLTLYAQWIQDLPPSGDGGGSGGVSSSPPPSIATPEANVPGINWTPLKMIEGDSLGDDQLNATFSVPGNATYSLSRGFKPEVGSFTLTVTFTPNDRTSYMVLSTTRTIEVSAKPMPAPSQTSLPSPTPKSSATPSPLPTPVTKPETVKISQLKKIGTIYFNNNEYFLDAKDRSALKEISRIIQEARYPTVIIQGNTDIKQGVDNFWLSKARAEAVSNYLTNLNTGSLYNRVWYASKRPVAVGLDKKSLALNRRVEIYAQVTIEKLKTEMQATPQIAVVKTYAPISFNRNESFLDAEDRNSLIKTVQSMAKLGCTRVYLQGSHDRTKSAVNAYIGANRVNAVRKFMAGLYPTLKFDLEPEVVSAKREVKIRCTS